jgi:nardilysin
MDAKLAALKEISFGDIQQINVSFYQIRGIIFGCIPKEEAMKIAKILKTSEMEVLPCARNRNVKNTVELAYGSREIKSTVRSKTETNSLCKVFYQIVCEKDQSHKETVLVCLFERLLADRFWRELRLQQNVGYDVDCEGKSEGVKGLCFTVLSDRYDPDELQKRIHSFLSTTVFSLKLDRLKKSASLDKCGESVWTLLLSEEYSASYFSDFEDCLEALTVEDLITEFRKHFGVGESRVLKVGIWGCNTNTGGSG